jgi:hypothetical protein
MKRWNFKSVFAEQVRIRIRLNFMENNMTTKVSSCCKSKICDCDACKCSNYKPICKSCDNFCTLIDQPEPPAINFDSSSDNSQPKGWDSIQLKAGGTEQFSITKKNEGLTLSEKNDKVIDEIRNLCDYLKKEHETLAKRTHVRPLDEFEEGKYSTLELIIMDLENILPPKELTDPENKNSN